LIDVRKSNHEISSNKNARDLRFPKSAESNTLGNGKGNGKEAKLDARVEAAQLNVTQFLEQPKIQLVHSPSVQITTTTYLTTSKRDRNNDRVSLTDSLSQIISFLYEVKEFKGKYENLFEGIKEFLDRKIKLDNMILLWTLEMKKEEVLLSLNI
jgi:hypothetical protein